MAHVTAAHLAVLPQHPSNDNSDRQAGEARNLRQPGARQGAPRPRGPRRPAAQRRVARHRFQHRGRRLGSWRRSASHRQRRLVSAVFHRGGHLRPGGWQEQAALHHGLRGHLPGVQHPGLRVQRLGPHSGGRRYVSQQGDFPGQAEPLPLRARLQGVARHGHPLLPAVRRGVPPGHRAQRLRLPRLLLLRAIRRSRQQKRAAAAGPSDRHHRVPRRAAAAARNRVPADRLRLRASAGLQPELPAAAAELPAGAAAFLCAAAAGLRRAGCGGRLRSPPGETGSAVTRTICHSDSKFFIFKETYLAVTHLLPVPPGSHSQFVF
ncbi:hypothetical protein BOX15_Mlig002825g1 [Macrostomum lignano]|uniref:Uncharacterized protein n=1 Tax=Macrostomum lignano TaxID=282301 RepID=A0A267EDP8_9PLAT|nr:hypothetical protein BOX15_Mlig002825g1 [Macrostomum lignano]